MEASRLRTLMKKSRLLPQALCFLSLFLIFGVQGYAQNCTYFGGLGNVPPSLGIGGSLNGFLPFQGTSATEYGPSAWNYNISGAPVDANSAAIIADITHNNFGGGAPSKLHPDFGPVGGMPYTVVDTTVQPFIDMNGPAAGPNTPNQSYASQSDAVVEPAPITAPIEGQEADCLAWPATEPNYYFGDTHMLIIDRNECFLYETYLTSRCDGQFSVGGQALWDLEFGEVRPYGWTSTDAAGLPVWPGLVKFDEACSSYVNDVDDTNSDGNCAATQPINHAFRFTLNDTKGDNDGGYFVFPAGHGAAADYRWKYPNPMGMRIRLKASTNISSFSPINQAILTAMENYGLILADNGSNMYVSGTTDSRWNTVDLGNWHGGGDYDCSDPSYVPGPGVGCYLTSADFEVVQMANENENVEDVTNYGSGDPATYSYMDASSAPYTVNDVQQLITSTGDTGDPANPTSVGTPITGGTGPEGTTLAGYGGEDPNDGSETYTGGVNVPTNSLEAQAQILGIPFGPSLCGSAVIPGYPVVFSFDVSGSTYNYIDNAGPVRVDGGGFGALYFTPTNTQTFTLYSMNSSGMTTSTSCTLYTINAQLPTPILSPSTGTYNTVINVQISDPGYPGATIYYTTDESEPTYPPALGSTEQVYSGPITVTTTPGDPNTYLPGEQINAIAVDSQFTNPSEIGSAVYIVNSAITPPVITPVSGTYDLGTTITITDSTNPIDLSQGEVTWIYYTTDGSTPSGDQFGDVLGGNNTQICGVGPNGGPCNYSLTGGATIITAVANALGYTQSAAVSATYDVDVTYSLVVTPSVVTTQIGSTAASAIVTLTPLNGYTGTITFTCAGLPAADTCVFSPSSITLPVTGTGYGEVVITFSQVSAHNNSNPLFPGGATLAVALCFFGLRKRRRLQMLLLLAVSVIGLGLFTGCGTPATIPVDATVVVTGTDGNGLQVSGSFLLIENLPGTI